LAPVAAPPASAPVAAPLRTATFTLGFGFGFGLFLSPTDVNRYMADWVTSRGDFVTLQEQAEKLLLFYLPVLSVDLLPVRFVRLQAASELGWGPKIAAVNNASADTRLFQFIRMSEVLTANLELPIDTQGTMELFVGGGPSLSYLKFEEHHAATAGARVQLGFVLLQKTLRVDGLVAFDYIKAHSDRLYRPPARAPRPFELDYTSLHLDAVIHFDIVR